MNQPQRVYQRILRLPCGDIREGVGLKDMLDSALKQVTTAICKSADGFKVNLGNDSSGQLQATIMRGAHKIELQGLYGQNTIFKDGAKASFVSYTVRAESAFSPLDRIENAGEGFVVLGRIAGVMLGVFAVCAVVKYGFERVRMVVYSIPVFLGIVYAGKWLGEKAARWIVGAIQTQVATAVLPGQDVAKAEAAWQRLTDSIDAVTSSYPAV